MLAIKQGYMLKICFVETSVIYSHGSARRRVACIRRVLIYVLVLCRHAPGGLLFVSINIRCTCKNLNTQTVRPSVLSLVIVILRSIIPSRSPPQPVIADRLFLFPSSCLLSFLPSYDFVLLFDLWKLTPSAAQPVLNPRLKQPSLISRYI